MIKLRKMNMSVSLMPRMGKKRSWWRPWMTWTSIGLGSVLVLILAVAAYYYPKARQVLGDVRHLETVARKISSDVGQQKFAAATEQVHSLQGAIDQTTLDLHRMAGLSRWPYIGRQYQTADKLLHLASPASQAVAALIDFANHLFAPFSGQGTVSLSSISPAQKGQLLAGMANQQESLQAARTAIHHAGDILETIPDRGLIGPLQKQITPLKEQFPLIERALDQAIPATHVLPAILGYPAAKSYLFLLENNTELRPAGGFIGTYGVLKVSSGDIVSLKTDNSYNLDEAAKKLPVVAPPAPLTKYLKADAWYFRDANWSPDFPTAAKQALFFYQREGGQKNMDGVIGVTPTTITALLQLVGPITIGSTTFTADNFTTKLQYYVDLGYAKNGMDISQRKDIIGPMTKELVDRLLKLPLSRWKDVFLVMNEQLNDKQFMFYLKDQALESILTDQNWGGAMVDAAKSDYLAVIDANLASLKSDPAVDRSYAYALKLDGARPDATLTVHYHHTGKFGWKTTRYNTFVRVYVPAGSQLIDSRGPQLREKSTKAGEVTTTTELGKTVFSAFKSIEPGTDSDLVLHYALPADLVFSRTYDLVWQKQPGAIGRTVSLVIKRPGHKVSLVEGIDTMAKIDQDSVSFSDTLEQDRTMHIHYR